jgi:1-deoxy-D-xylulose-5-phosphate reductoisomerase
MARATRIIVLGSTGSIGTQTLDVVSSINDAALRGDFPRRIEVVGLAAGSDPYALAEQAAAFGVGDIALARDDSESRFRLDPFRARFGEDAAERLVREVECDLVISSIVGFAGLGATLAAVEMGVDVALANKETLVAAGALVTDTARRTGSRLLPVDSEHSGVWQCLMGLSSTLSLGERVAPKAPGEGVLVPPCALGSEVRRVTLTASGGALRDWPLDQLQHATAKDALAHPTWSMGPKVTIDCASLMNKALELIEAHWLFGLRSDRLGAIIHPQSIVHAFVETSDGSVLAQLGAPDMRTPIQVALTHPDRAPVAPARLDVTKLASLDFRPIDEKRYPAYALAKRVMDAPESKGSLGAILNAANEEAVEAFMKGDIDFGAIAQAVRDAMDTIPARPIRSLADVLAADAEARMWTRTRLSRTVNVGK